MSETIKQRPTIKSLGKLLVKIYLGVFLVLIQVWDSSAHIAFGSIVQPTPIRLRYLERAWDQLVLDAGSLVDA